MDYMDQTVSCSVCGKDTSSIMTRVCFSCEGKAKAAARKAEWDAKSDPEKAIVMLGKRSNEGGVWLEKCEADLILRQVAALAAKQATSLPPGQPEGLPPEMRAKIDRLKDETDFLVTAVNDFVGQPEGCDLVKRLRIMAGMVTMGERITWGSDSAIMQEAASMIEAFAARQAPAAQPLSRIDQEHLRIGQQIHRAAGELPDGWNLEVRVEKGYGGAALFDPEGDQRKDLDAADSDGLSYAIEKVINFAKEKGLAQ